MGLREINGEMVDMPSHSVMGSEMIDPDLRNRTSYESFLAKKRFTPIVSGLTTVPPLNPKMFPHQRDVTSWALRLGRAATFLGTGLGKSFIELEWSRVISSYTTMPVLILAPLSVCFQMVREAEKFGIEGVKYCHNSDEAKGISIVVTNYERLDHFDPSDYSGVVLDESSCLKAMDGVTKNALIESFSDTPYKLCGTATPSPNDTMELGNHAEFLGVMKSNEMLSTFFTHDGGETQKWRLKGHARQEFWKWVCSWAVNIRTPGDVGYDNGPFVLPLLIYHEHIVKVNTPSEGMLFAMPAETMGERLSARRSTVDDRVAKAVEIVNNEDNEIWIIWTNLNRESDLITKSLDGSIEVTGSDSADYKAQCALEFSEGYIQRLVSKSAIFGWGSNFQSCSHMIHVGVTDSFESFFQSVRRCWRFGQTKPVHVHIIAASTEGNVLENLKRKEREAEQMADEMVANMQDLTRLNLTGTIREVTPYEPKQEITIPEWMK